MPSIGDNLERIEALLRSEVERIYGTRNLSVAEAAELIRQTRYISQQVDRLQAEAQKRGRQAVGGW